MIDLKEQYGKRYKVTRCGLGEIWCYEIVGKYGYIRSFTNELELYLSRPMIEKRIERDYPAFKPKNHYDDATTFTFRNDSALVACAAKWIKAKNRRQATPALLERLAKIRSLIKKPLVASDPAV